MTAKPEGPCHTCGGIQPATWRTAYEIAGFETTGRPLLFLLCDQCGAFLKISDPEAPGVGPRGVTDRPPLS